MTFYPNPSCQTGNQKRLSRTLPGQSFSFYRAATNQAALSMTRYFLHLPYFPLCAWFQPSSDFCC